MGGRQVLGDGAVAAALRRAQVRGHALAAAEDLDGVRRDAQLHRGVHERVRHAVVMAVEHDVVVDVDLGRPVAGELVAVRRQRPQRRPIERLVGTAPAARQALERPAVEVAEQLADRDGRPR